MDVIDNQVRSLRKRELIASYQRGDVDGCYWGIRTHWADYGLADDPLGAAGRDPAPLAAMPTRLKAVPRALQDRVMNWGYAVCDAGLRAHVGAELQGRLGVRVELPAGFPFSGGY